MNYKDAAGNVKSLARTFQSVIDLADSLDELASLDQAVNERTNAFTKLDAQIADKTNECDSLKDNINKNKLTAESILSEAKNTAELIVLQANVDSANILDKAGIDAATARESARNYSKDIDAKVARMNADLESKAIELEYLNNKIEKAQNQINKMLAG